MHVMDGVEAEERVAAIIADTLFLYREPPGLSGSRPWGREHAESRAEAVVRALRRAGVRFDAPQSGHETE